VTEGDEARKSLEGRVLGSSQWGEKLLDPGITHAGRC